MDLYNFTGWGFFITVGSVFLLYAYVRQFFIAFMTDWEKQNTDLKTSFDRLQRTVDAIERRLEPFDSN